MNSQKIYSQLIGRIPNNPDMSAITPDGTPVQIEPSTEKRDDAARFQAKSNWLQSTITQEMRESIQKDIDTLIDEAMKLASSYSMHNNHQLIINKLINAHALRKVIENYASTNTPQ